MTKKVAKLGAIIIVLSLLFTTMVGVKAAYANDVIPKVDKIIREYDTVYEGDTLPLDILIKGRDKVQYKVWLNNKTKGTWEELTKEFSNPVESNRVYNIVLPKLTEGDYRVSVWVKRAGQTPLNKNGYDSYSFIDFSCFKSEGKSPNISISEIKNNYAIGNTVEVKKNTENQYLYKYSIVNAINNKEVVAYKDYTDSLAWKAATEGLYLMKINVKYTEKVAVPKPEPEKKPIDEITENEVDDEVDNKDEVKVLDSEDKNDIINSTETDEEDITDQEILNINEEVKEEESKEEIKEEEPKVDEPKEEIEYKEVEREVKITKLIMVGDPFKYVGPTAPSVNSLVVGNAGEGARIYIKAQANANSKNVGYIYGSLHGVKILNQVGKFYYIEATDYASLKTVKGYVYTSQLKTVKPSGDYSILVDISDQKVYVFKNKKLFKTIVCSTGLDATPTPTGTYLVGDRGSHFYTGYNNQIVCNNWVRINNNFLFHSVLLTRGGQVIQSEAAKLGSKASHGCIRLPLNDSKWIYDNIPRGTLVVIQN